MFPDSTCTRMDKCMYGQYEQRPLVTAVRELRHKSVKQRENTWHVCLYVKKDRKPHCGSFHKLIILKKFISQRKDKAGK